MARPKITLFIDIVSPFAYIGFFALQNFPVFKQCEITYIPVLLGGLMKMCGNTPPLEVKNKDKWINSERQRWAKYFNIPISPTTPPNFPINTLPIQRALTSLSISHPQSLPDAISLFYEKFWVHWAEPHRPDVLEGIVGRIVGEQEARRVTEKYTSDEVKEKLRQNTERAFREGAFGLPWFVVTNANGETEAYWGVDHMGQMCDHLGLERPTGSGWKALL